MNNLLRAKSYILRKLAACGMPLRTSAMVRLLSCLLFLVTCAAAVVQGLDAFMVTPLRGYMSKMINVEDQGKQVGAFLGLGRRQGLP